MRVLLITLVMFSFLSCFNKKEKNDTNLATATEVTQTQKQSLHNFKVEALDGSEFDLASLKGKKVMVVNTASKCGLTPQYEQLQALYEEYKDDNFVIVGFPANNFLWQEPGSNKEIAAFCQKNYGVTFPMMAKISVKGGDKHPVYQFLTEKSKNGFQDSKVKWNFQKYLVNENGEIEKIIAPKTLPTDTSVVEWIKG